MKLATDGRSRLTIYLSCCSLGFFPREGGFYRDSYRSSDGSVIRVLQFGRIARFAWWSAAS